MSHMSVDLQVASRGSAPLWDFQSQMQPFASRNLDTIPTANVASHRQLIDFTGEVWSQGVSSEIMLQLPTKLTTEGNCGNPTPLSTNSPRCLQNSSDGPTTSCKYEVLVKEEANINGEGLLNSNLEMQRPFHCQRISTKNLLRNFGVAQNSFILYSRRARTVIQQCYPNPQQFRQRVRQTDLKNFVDYRNIWGNRTDPFCQLYRVLCWIFYTQSAIPYILNSRMKKSQEAHLAFLHKFIEGITDPSTFRKFK